jgi:hypothetical protein
MGRAIRQIGGERWRGTRELRTAGSRPNWEGVLSYFLYYYLISYLTIDSNLN